MRKYSNNNRNNFVKYRAFEIIITSESVIILISSLESGIDLTKWSMISFDGRMFEDPHKLYFENITRICMKLQEY